MKKLILLLIILTMFISGHQISTYNSLPQNQYVHPLLKEAYKDWRKECKKRNVDLFWFDKNVHTISIGILPGNKIGYCYIHEGIIIIDYYLLLGEDPFFNTKLTLFHELGHCALNKRHTCSKLAIMNPERSSKQLPLYKMSWKFLLDDYFGYESICPEE